MSISFSGLASGLDTTSWINSLTALKRAKVTSYQKDKEVLMSSKEALSRIQTFFQSFRSMLERVTDARFNVESSNIFGQNVAASSNAAVLTATARADADLGVYNIKVQQLATNSQAVSKFSYTTTIVTTTDANSDSLLKDLGVREGNILVTKSGVQSTVRIAADDTISSFIDKLSRVGVQADFNNATGVFTMDVNMVDIADVGATRIVNALNLQAVNRGYSTASNLYKPVTDSVYTPAEGSTKLSDLGVRTGTMSIKTSDATYDVTIGANDTVQDLITALGTKGINASIEDGVFTISNAVITSQGATQIIDALGLNNNTIASNTQISSLLSYDTVVTTTTSATGSTQLSVYDVNAGVFTISNSDSTYSITIGANETIDGLISKLDAKGIHAHLDTEGLFTIDDANITNAGTTNIINGLGLSQTISDNTQRSRLLAYQTIVTNTIEATGSTKATALAVRTGTYTVVSNETAYTFTITNNTTMQTIINDLGTKGIEASLTDGHFRIANANISGEGTTNIKAALKIDNPEVASQTQKSRVLTHTTVITTATAATESTELRKINGVSVSNGQTIVYKNPSNLYRTITLGTGTTVGDIMTHLRNNGVTVSQRANGSLYIVGAEITGGTFDAVTALKLNNVSGDSGTLTYSGSALEVITTTTVPDDVTNEILLSDCGVTSGQYYIYSNGTRYTANIGVDDTFGDFRDALRAYGIQAGLVRVSGGMQLIVTGTGDSYVATSNAVNHSNIVDTLFSSGKITTYNYESDLYTTSTSNPTVQASNDAKLSDFGITSGQYFIYQNGEKHVANIFTTDTFGDLKNTLLGYGLQASLVNEADGVHLVINGNGDSYIAASAAATASNLVTNLFPSGKTSNYDYATTLTIERTNDEVVNATNDTLMSDFGVTSGQYYIYNNGVKYVANISSSETFGEFRETLRTFGLQTGLVTQDDGVHLVITGNGDSYVGKSTAPGSSNIVDRLFASGKNSTYDYVGHLGITSTVTTNVTATLDTKLSDYDNGSNKNAGRLAINYDGNVYAINLSEDDTFGTLINKLGQIGINAELSAEGKLSLLSGEKDFSIDTTTSTSKLVSNLGLVFNNNNGNYVASSSPVKSTTTVVEERSISATNHADTQTQLKLLNVTSGSLSVYRNGERVTVQVNANDKFEDLQRKINEQFADGKKDIEVSFDDGYLKIRSTTAGVSVDVGSSIDSSNIATVCGLTSDEQGGITSFRELYKVNTDTIITNSGLFREGTVKEGTFIVGNAVFNIDATTTMAELIAQINFSDESNATAFWDSVDGKLVIKSRVSGSTYINIEAGSSNFTDIMGFTTSEWDASGALISTKLNSFAQEVGDSALFTINGTSFSSTSNTVGSDISRINGVTLNLKNISEDETVTLTVEGDTETAANAISDVVNAYNELIQNIDTELAKGGSLSDQMTLKTLRNQIRSMMTSSIGGENAFSSLLSVGISTDSARSGNISTAGIDILSFDKEKFANAYKADRLALQKLFVGTDESKGVFRRVNDVVSNALTSVSGFFAISESSYNKKISNLDNKISKANTAVDAYKARLETKFQAMDMLIAKIQQQYQSFLGV